MEQRRLILIILLALFASFLWHNWTVEHISSIPAQQTLEQPDASSFENNSPIDSENNNPSAVTAQTPVAEIIHVKTDVLDLAINSLDQNIFQAALVNYPAVQGQPAPVVLLNNDPLNRYLAKSQLLSLDKTQRTDPFIYQPGQTDYTLQQGQNKLIVNLTYVNHDIKMIKTYTFERGKYNIGLTYHIQNQSTVPWSGYINNSLSRVDPKTASGGMFHVSSYTGASVSTQDSPYQKISFKDMTKSSLNITTLGGWAAMQEHYFLSAWVPDKQSNNRYYSAIENDGLFTIGVIGPVITIPPQSSATTTMQLYVGPELGSQLKTLAPHLDLTIDYGWLWFISDVIFWLMAAIHQIVGNWGWSIVFVTILIKLMFYPLSATSYRSMARMRKIQPKLQALKDRYGDDRQKLAQETMQLYRQEKANPMSGCLPVLVQIPVFIALYWVLVESVQLRQAPFIFWIHDLAARDPYFILPIINGLLMFFQQKLNPPPPDPAQAKVMMFLPVLFTFIFINFPAGLVLYWVVNSLVSILQQWFITRQVQLKEEITLVSKKPL